MNTTSKSALELVHRLLFRALLEIRAQGHEQNNKLVFHLADLFHNAVLEMEAAAEGRSTYEEVFRHLEEKAKEKNYERWLQSAVTQSEMMLPSGPGASRPRSAAGAAEQPGTEHRIKLL